MKKLFAILILIVSPYATAQVNETITWQGRAAVGGYAPEGTLEIMDASATLEDDNLIKLSVVVDMRTLEQENTQLRDHLRREDFFHVKKFPVATFIFEGPVIISNDSVDLKGKMTIRGITSEENIKAGIKIEGDRIEISFDHTMNRLTYGIT